MTEYQVDDLVRVKPDTTAFSNDDIMGLSKYVNAVGKVVNPGDEYILLDLTQSGYADRVTFRPNEIEPFEPFKVGDHVIIKLHNDAEQKAIVEEVVNDVTLWLKGDGSGVYGERFIGTQAYYTVTLDPIQPKFKLYQKVGFHSGLFKGRYATVHARNRMHYYEGWLKKGENDPEYGYDVVFTDGSRGHEIETHMYDATNTEPQETTTMNAGDKVRYTMGQNTFEAEVSSVKDGIPHLIAIQRVLPYKTNTLIEDHVGNLWVYLGGGKLIGIDYDRSLSVDEFDDNELTILAEPK